MKLTQSGFTIVHEEEDENMILALIGNNFYDVANFISGKMPIAGENIVRSLRIMYANVRAQKVNA